MTTSNAEAEAVFYYSGLCSSPRLKKPTRPEAYNVLNELRPVFGHKLNTIWKDLGPKVCDLLDSHGIMWTTIDIVRFIKIKRGEVVGPVVLWIGVALETLTGECARPSANGCLDLLKEFDITDVEVAFRESIYMRSAGPSVPSLTLTLQHPTTCIHSPLTSALGLSISTQATPHVEGTGGLYLAEGGDSNKILLVTARHVLFPPNEGPNNNYDITNANTPHRNVLLLGIKALRKLVESIRMEIATIGKRNLRRIRTVIQNQGPLDKATEAIGSLKRLLKEIRENWSEPNQRVLGHIIRSPPISMGAGTEGFTEDYAVVELDNSKINENFKGNIIDTRMELVEFIGKMVPHTGSDTVFECRFDRLLQLDGILSEDVMHSPDTFDRNDEPCLVVVRNGNATGTTIGRPTGVFSYVREYYTNGTHSTSTEWAILPYDYKSGDFSLPGDSGAVVADCYGRIGGLLTGGAGKIGSFDITYATPFFWRFPRIKENGFPNAYIYPVI
ncbi:hypothetical protein BDZ94DRAFT_1377389 [Collybia nuda]|uniref:Uncharacterized protein n=1 Tax=Collybia nuda TaxID=64659 RepID=A0A9P5XZC7_9AGAR|nr:hypothetical protein BDZ94DRAFT_1377389 [Collybia nuda]